LRNTFTYQRKNIFPDYYLINVERFQDVVVLNKSWYKPDQFWKPVRFFEENHYLLFSTTNEGKPVGMIATGLVWCLEKIFSAVALDKEYF
jgi:hypothetical protein